MKVWRSSASPHRVFNTFLQARLCRDSPLQPNKHENYLTVASSPGIMLGMGNLRKVGIYSSASLSLQIKGRAAADATQHCCVLCFHGSLRALCVGGPSRWAALIMKLLKPLRSDRHLLLIGNSSRGRLIFLKGKCSAVIKSARLWCFTQMS